MISLFFLNKGFNQINLGLILYLDNIKNLFPYKLKIDGPASVLYNLDKTIRNKILSYKETVSPTDTNDNVQHSHNRMWLSAT